MFRPAPATHQKSVTRPRLTVLSFVLGPQAMAVADTLQGIATAPWLSQYRIPLAIGFLALCLLGIVCWFFIIITRRLQAQMREKTALAEALRQSEQEHRKLMEMAPFPIIVTRQDDGRIEYVNRRASELFGTTAEKLLGKATRDHYVDPNQRQHLIDQVTREGRALDFETEIRDRTGKTYQIMVSSILGTMNQKPVVISAFSDISELKKAQAEITHREWQLRKLIEEAPVPILIARASDSTLYYLNRHAGELLGLTEEADLNYPLAKLFVAQQDLEQIHASRDAQGWIKDFPTRMCSKTRQIFWVLVSSQLGEMDGLQVVFYSFIDVTVQKENQDAIVHSEEEQRQLLDRAPIPIFITRLADSQLMYANRLACEQMGWDLVHLEREKAVDYYSEEDRARLIALLRQEGFVSDFESRLRPRNSKPFWALCTVGVANYRRQTALMATFSNIDERKRMEKILRDSEERFRFIAENTEDVIWQMDRDLKIIYINEADERLRGIPRERVIGQPARILYDEARGNELMRRWQRRMEQEANGIRKGASTYETQQIKADGSNIWVEIVVSPQRDANGDIASFLGVTRDITARKQAEEELRSANTKLAEQLEQIQSLQAALREQAIRDPLTGLFNRRYFDEAVEIELARAQREGYPVTFALLDLDHFKQVNDTYGHQAGDEALRTLAQLLSEAARASDIPCRFGGEEFLLLLPNMGLDDAIKRAENWRRQLAEKEIRFGQLNFHITVSIGLAAYPQHGRRIEDLLSRADQALYAAKSAGRNRVITAHTL